MTKGILKSVGEDPLADEIRSAIGAGPHDVVEIATPTFHRTTDMGKVHPPPDPFESIRDRSYEELRSLGLHPWDDPDLKGDVLLLFPGEWYSSIPAGFEIVDINDLVEVFVPGKSDNDIRFGCLPYGIKAKPKGKL